jgi:hypothetical protein
LLISWVFATLLSFGVNKKGAAFSAAPMPCRCYRYYRLSM